MSAEFLWKDSRLKNSNDLETKEEEMKILQLEYESLMEKNMDLQKELRKYRIDFELIEQELKKQNEICLLRENLQTELDNVQKLKTELEKNNENLVIELEKYKVEYEMIQEELKQQNTEYIPKLRSDLENMDFQKQALITELEEMRNHNERLIEKLKLNEDKEDRLNERISELENNQKEVFLICLEFIKKFIYC